MPSQPLPEAGNRGVWGGFESIAAGAFGFAINLLAAAAGEGGGSAALPFSLRAALNYRLNAALLRTTISQDPHQGTQDARKLTALLGMAKVDTLARMVPAVKDKC